jgi:hypothetical protein
MSTELSATTIEEPFELEVVSAMSEDDYVRWHAIRPTRPRRARVWKWLLTVAAAACFVSWTTVVLGIVLGAVALAVWTSPRWLASSNRSSYRQAEYLHGPLIYGVSSRGMWFRGGEVRSESTWAGLRIWGEQDGCFWLAASGMPQLIFPIDRLHEAGIYERVRRLATTHGVEFDSPAARAGLRRDPGAAAT